MSYAVHNTVKSGVDCPSQSRMAASVWASMHACSLSTVHACMLSTTRPWPRRRQARLFRRTLAMPVSQVQQQTDARDLDLLGGQHRRRQAQSWQIDQRFCTTPSSQSL
eukprot:6182258-Pleurochrysis_carterae.AAC.4